MIPRYGFNKCLISKFSFNVFEQYHNRRPWHKTLLKERVYKILFLTKGEGEEIE